MSRHYFILTHCWSKTINHSWISYTNPSHQNSLSWLSSVFSLLWGMYFFEENYNVCFLPLLSTWTTWRLQQNIFNAKIIAYHSSSWICLFTLSFWRWYTCELSSLILEFQSINLWEITLFYCLGMFVVISHPELNYEFGGINCLTLFEHHL